MDLGEKEHLRGVAEEFEDENKIPFIFSVILSILGCLLVASLLFIYYGYLKTHLIILSIVAGGVNGFILGAVIDNLHNNRKKITNRNIKNDVMRRN